MEAKLLPKLMAFSLESSTKQWTPLGFEKLSNTLKILVSPKKKTPSFFAYHFTHTVIRMSENVLNKVSNTYSL